MRAAIYARYSSDLQDEASIEIQVQACEEFATQKNWTVSGSYIDRGISGRTVSQRPEFKKLLQDAEHGKFDILLALHSDRVSRAAADMTALYRDLNYLGIELHTVHEGHQNDGLLVSVRGAMNEHYSRELGKKTKLGQKKRVAEGKKAGGKAYGYRVVEPVINGKHIERGDREIIQDEAEIVIRIFTEYAAGLSPRAIAKRLNEEGIPGPNGIWIDTTIRGQRNRGTGILNNDNYRGINCWNKCPYTINPRTGKKVARPNPPEEWLYEECEKWRIVSDELWSAVKAQQDRNKTTMPKEGGVALNRLNRKKHLLSGLVTCGFCNGPMAINNGPSYSCSNRRRKGNCSNTYSVNRQELEDRVLAGIKNELLQPDYIEEFVSEYAAELNKVSKTKRPETERLEIKRKKTQSSIDNLINAIKTGKATDLLMDELDSEKAKLSEVETSLKELQSARVSNKVPQTEPKEVYWDTIDKLHEYCTDQATKSSAMTILRSLIEGIAVGGPDDDPERVTLSGDAGFLIENIHALTTENTDQDDGSGLSMLSVVAGAGFEPATFRL